MPRGLPPPEVLSFLRRPNPAVIATLRADGAPHTAPTWYLVEDDGTILLSAAAGRVRLAHLARDPRASLSVVGGAGWERHVTVTGQIVRTAADPAVADMDRIARHYTGRPHPRRDVPRVSIWLAVEAWHGWDPEAGDVWRAAATG
jgi:PPOX class probable F420-dependent enzyme